MLKNKTTTGELDLQLVLSFHILETASDWMMKIELGIRRY